MKMNQNLSNEIIDGFPIEKIISYHYFNRYLKFISSKYGKNEKTKFTERHHIVPISLNKNLKKCPENIIILTPREHFIAHYMLGKAFGGKQWYACNLIAMAENPYQCRKAFLNCNSKLYLKSQEMYLNHLSSNMKESRRNESNEKQLNRVQKWRETSPRCPRCNKILRRGHDCETKDRFEQLKKQKREENNRIRAENKKLKDIEKEKELIEKEKRLNKIKTCNKPPSKKKLLIEERLKRKLERERKKREKELQTHLENIEKFGENYKDLTHVEKQKISARKYFDNLSNEEKQKRSELYRYHSLNYYNSDRYDPNVKSEQIKNGIKNSKKNRSD